MARAGEHGRSLENSKGYIQSESDRVQQGQDQGQNQLLLIYGHPPVFQLSSPAYLCGTAPSCQNWISISPTTMVPPKKQKSKAAASGTDTQSKDAALSSSSPYSTFPLSRYASLLGSQTLGLGFTLGMLPRTRVLQPELAKLFGTQSSVKSSQDHPQHPFLDPLTESPARTLLWLCAGSFFLVAWSAGSLRLWNVGEQPTPVPTEPKKAEGSAKTMYGVRVTVPPTPARLLVSTSHCLTYECRVYGA